MNRRPSGRTLSVPAGLGIGALISMFITVFMAAILAKLVDAEKLPWESIGYGVMLLLLAASFLGALAAYSRVKRQRLIVCLLSGVVYFGILLSITALFFGCQYEGAGVTAILILGGSGVAGLLSAGRGGKRKYHRTRNR